MFDEARLRRNATPVLLGTISAVLYGTVAFMPLFLVPLQYSGARKGYRSMIASAVASSVIIAVWQVVALARAGIATAATLAMGIAAPAAMILALVAMASPRLGRFSFATRALLGAMAASLVSLPSIFAAIKDPGVRGLFVDAFEKAGSAIGAGSLDAETMWLAVKTGVASSYGAVLFVFLFLSAWSGTRLGTTVRPSAVMPAEQGGEPTVDASASKLDRPSLPPTLAAYRVPGSLVWVLLAAWAGLLLNRFVPSLVLSAVALNAALALSICYGVQGLAVVRALAERVGLAPALRFLGPIALILLLVSGVAGLVAVGVLALLGTLETWIPFRAATKGELP